MIVKISGCFLIKVLTVFSTLELCSGYILINHDKENLHSLIRNEDGILSTSISENTKQELKIYLNNANNVQVKTPAKETNDDKIVYSYNIRRNDGSENSFAYATSNGSTRTEIAKFTKEPNTQQETLDVKGSYSYVGNDGYRYIIGYTADKNGYRPKVSFGTKVEIIELPTVEDGDRAHNPQQQQNQGNKEMKKEYERPGLVFGLLGGGNF